MRIGIDVREGGREKRAGKGEYVYQLTSQLVLHSDHQFILFSDAPLPDSWNLPSVRPVVIRAPALLWHLIVWFYLEFFRPVDVYFSTTSVIVPALLRSLPVVTTLFDFTSFIFPEHHQNKAVLIEKIWMRLALKHSRQLLAISQSTKNDAVRLFKINPAKITVAYLGPALSNRAEPLDLPTGPIILFVGTLEPRKNVVTLVRAFNQLRGENELASLVLAGDWGWRNEEISKAITQSPYTADIHVLGYVDEAQKAYLYQHATVLAFPSWYEGFGMPPLEAMSAGLPVVAANVSSLPEVVGDAGLLISPASVGELAAALKRVLKDDVLRDQLRQRGLTQSKKFNWQNTADVTLGVLTSLSA